MLFISVNAKIDCLEVIDVPNINTDVTIKALRNLFGHFHLQKSLFNGNVVRFSVALTNFSNLANQQRKAIVK